jgi:hypothetical protein
MASNSSSSTTRDLVKIINDHTSATGAVCLALQQDSANKAMFIDQNANHVGISIDAENTTNPAFYIESDVLTSGSVAEFTSDAPDNSSSRSIVKIVNNNAAADNAVGLLIQQDGDDAHIEFTGAGGGGIKFTADIASSDSDTLDDYEEGTWTMTANNSVTLHAASNLGSYTKVGRLVTCAGQARVNDDNSTAELSLNLPFTSLSTLGEGANLYQGALSIYLATSPASVLWGLVQNEANSIILQLSGQRASAATTPFLATANGYYTFTISYLVG